MGTTLWYISVLEAFWTVRNHGALSTCLKGLIETWKTLKKGKSCLHFNYGLEDLHNYTNLIGASHAGAPYRYTYFWREEGTKCLQLFWRSQSFDYDRRSYTMLPKLASHTSTVLVHKCQNWLPENHAKLKEYSGLGSSFWHHIYFSYYLLYSWSLLLTAERIKISRRAYELIVFLQNGAVTHQIVVWPTAVYMKSWFSTFR